MIRRKSVLVSSVFNVNDESESDDDDDNSAPRSARSFRSMRSCRSAAAPKSARLHRTMSQKHTSKSQTTPAADIPKEVHYRFERWSVRDVADWVEDVISQRDYPSNTVDDLHKIWEEHKIRGSMLVGLERDDWKTLVPPIAVRKDLLAAFEKLKEDDKESDDGGEPFSSGWSFGSGSVIDSEGSDSDLIAPSEVETAFSELAMELTITPRPPNPGELLWEKSGFSNVPLIDHYIFAFGFRRLHWNILVYILKIIFIIQTLVRLIPKTDILLLLYPIACVWLCTWFNVAATLHPGLFLSIVVFPLSFAVNAAYSRREQALQILAFFRACSFSVFLCHKSWQSTTELPPGYLHTTSHKLLVIFHSLRLYLVSSDETEKEFYLESIYHTCADLSMHTDIFRLCGFPPPLCTRPIHDLREMMASFERLRVFSDYRTPSAIRVFIKFALFVVSLVLTPYWVKVGLRMEKPYVGYIGAVAFFIILKVLSNVQTALENPYFVYGYSTQDSINLEYLRGVDLDQKPTKHNKPGDSARRRPSMMSRRASVASRLSMSHSPGPHTSPSTIHSVLRQRQMSIASAKSARSNKSDRIHPMKSVVVIGSARSASQDDDDYDEPHEDYAFTSQLSGYKFGS